MSRARELSKLGNLNVLSADDVSNEVGIASTVPRSTLDVRGELQVGTGIQVGPAGVITATSFDGGLSGNIVATACTFTTGTFNGNVTIGGTLTYEDVTNVDALGIVTARAGVNVSGGQIQVGVAYSVGAAGVCTAAGFVGNLTGTASNATTATNQSGGSVTATTGSFSSNLTVGSGITMGNAGVATFSGTSDVHLHDSVKLLIGDSSDLQIHHNGTDSNILGSYGDLYIQNTGSDADDINIRAQDDINLQVDNGEAGINIIGGGQVELYHHNSKKFETTDTGVKISDAILEIADTSCLIDLMETSATNHRIRNGSGNFYVQKISDDKGTTTDQLKIDGGTGVVELYYSGSKKFETTNDGVVITGIGTFSNGIVIPDDKIAKFGTGEDLQIYHTTSDNDGYIKYQNENGHLRILSGVSGNGGIKLNNRTDNAAYIHCDSEGAVKSYYNNSLRLSTTNEGIEVTGFTSTTAGMGVTGGLFEGAFIKAGKLSDNKTLGISTANVFYFTTQETTTATPDIRWNDSYTLSSKMAVGDVASVTVITTAAAGGYSANWTIDGNAVTEEWVGGSAPSAGGADGLDIYSFTIIKTGTGTGDSGWKVIGNLSNAT